MRLRLAGFLASVTLVVSGCGGGSSSPPPPPPPTAPTVTSTAPAGNATSVAVTGSVSATFSEAMSPFSLTTSTFTLTAPGGATVAGTVSYSVAQLTATFAPAANLAYGTQYTATITTGAETPAGTALAANYSWTFTTAPAPVPTVVAVTPANEATGVAVAGPAITATFSEAMNASSITASTFTLAAAGGATVGGTVSYNSTGFIATFAPTASLAYDTQYTATITTGAQSSAGAGLAANYSWTFTTAAAPPVPPTVTAMSPASGSTVVPVNATVTATFSEAMNSNTITGSSFTVAAAGGSAVNGLISYNQATQVATFTPSANLAYGTQYTVTLTTGITSTSGAALAAPVSWSFTTVQPPAPTVANTVPSANAAGVALDTTVAATFSQQMNSATLTGSTFTVTGASGSVSGLITYSSATATATFTPSSPLSYSTTYTATITTGAQNTSGTALAANYSWSFTTEANPSAVTVDFGTTYQTIRGFGGSTAWLGQMPQAVATALFSPTSGLGLSILRVRIDPEGSASGGGTHGDPYETGEWDYEAANGMEAVAANPNAIVFATPWTPPPAWKLNGTTISDDGESWNQSYNSCAEGTGYCGGYLNPSNYADYASYLEDFLTFFNSTTGFDLYAISMQNEPEENVTYESCVWTPEEMETWVAANASTITSDAYSTRLMMPESDTFNPIDAAPTLNNSTAQALVSIIGGHIYGVQPAPYSIPASDTPKELWMTEFGPLSNASAPTWSQTLSTYAESIHNSLVTGEYNAYVWWGLFGTSVGSGATAAGTWGLVDNAGNLTVTGEVMGQYSKFIEPGYVRASATASPVAGVYLSAYTGSASGTQHYVIVAINANSSAENLDFTLDNGSVTSFTPYQSTSTAGLQPQTAVPVTGGQFTYTLPAQSITTFVQ
jgi:O-glycosyl hydrolase